MYLYQNLYNSKTSTVTRVATYFGRKLITLSVHLICLQHVCRDAARRASSLATADTCVIKVKFHYAIQLASWSGLRPARDLVADQVANLVADRFELSRHVETVRTCLLHVGNQVCNQVCNLDSVMEFSLSRPQTSWRTSSRAGLRPAIPLRITCHYLAAKIILFHFRRGSAQP